MMQLITLILDKLLALFPGLQPYPRVLQFPITGRCNSKCGTCSVPELAPDVDMTIERVRQIMQNDLFKKLQAIGINGGEPSLVKELPAIIAELLCLPKLKSIHMITNGMLTERILEITKEINESCKAKGVHFSLSVSLDGIEEVYWACRGVSSFSKTIDTIKTVVENPGTYCSSFSAGCTVSKYNVDHLAANDAYCAEYNIPIFYRLAVPNRRIYNMGYSDDFSVLTDDADRRTAMEFFFGKIVDRRCRDWKQKFTYYAIFKYLEGKGHVRLADCFWKWRDATVDELGNIYYCATESKCLGTLDGSNATEIFHSKENLDYRKELIKEHCEHCIHYAFFPSIKGAFSFLFFFLHLVLFPARYQMGRRFH
ncbi:MAG: radical SAM protein [Kiritimatiellales bacterium]|nr:radical SAM protein [Kiritimatiellales bacterium]